MLHITSYNFNYVTNKLSTLKLKYLGINMYTYIYSKWQVFRKVSYKKRQINDKI
jgi:hypothetical protein